MMRPVTTACPDCENGWRINNPDWPSGEGFYREPCGECSATGKVQSWQVLRHDNWQTMECPVCAGNMLGGESTEFSFIRSFRCENCAHILRYTQEFKFVCASCSSNFFSSDADFLCPGCRE